MLCKQQSMQYENFCCFLEEEWEKERIILCITEVIPIAF